MTDACPIIHGGVLQSSDRRPQFLDLIDTDPDKAFDRFYRFALSRLTHTPPRPMASLPKEDREDIIQGVVYHCVKDDFRVLKSYQDQGKPFSHWLYIMAYNKSMDFYRDKNKRDYRGDEPSTDLPPDPAITDLLRAVRDCMHHLSEKCRLYLELAADEFKPREIVDALSLPSNQNVNVSNDLAYCRRKLRQCIVDNGYEVDDYL